MTIQKDVAIVVPIALLHKSPKHWKDPEIFDPDRCVYIMTFSKVYIVPSIQLRRFSLGYSAHVSAGLLRKQVLASEEDQLDHSSIKTSLYFVY